MCYGLRIVKRYLPALVVVGMLLGSFLARGAEPIGPENCKACHPQAYTRWKESGHARSATPLQGKQQTDGRCLSCHSPDRMKEMANVSCESCHGGGQYYSPSYVMKDKELSRAVALTDPSEKLCRKCHDSNAPSLKPFVFTEKLKQIDHWTAEREAREGVTETSAKSTSTGSAKDKPKSP